MPKFPAPKRHGTEMSTQRRIGVAEMAAPKWPSHMKVPHDRSMKVPHNPLPKKNSYATGSGQFPTERLPRICQLFHLFFSISYATFFFISYATFSASYATCSRQFPTERLPRICRANQIRTRTSDRENVSKIRNSSKI